MRSATKYLVKLDTENIDIEGGFYKKGDIKIFLPPDHELEYKHVPLMAEVIDIPKTNRYKIKIGDTVIINKFINDNVVERDIRYINEKKSDFDNSIYGIIRNNDFVMVNGNILVNPIKEDHFLLQGQNKEFEAIVSHNCIDSEMKKGDKVYHFLNNIINFDMLEEKHHLLRIESSIPAYESNGKFTLSNGWVEVKPISDNSGYEKIKSGIYLPSKKNGREKLAEIIGIYKGYDGELKEGDTVYFQRKERQSIEINGEVRYFSNIIRYDQIEFKID